MRPIAIAAKRKASGTALPTSPAGATPLSAIAAVGAMIPMETAIASQKRSSRRSVPWGRRWAADASVAISPPSKVDFSRPRRDYGPFVRPLEGGGAIASLPSATTQDQENDNGPESR